MFGIEETQNEDPAQTVSDLASVMGFEVKKEDVDKAYRAKKAGNYPGPLLVTMKNSSDAVKFLKNKMKLKGWEKEQRFKKVFVNEQLTLMRKKMLKAVKDDASMEKAWTVEGKIGCVIKGNTRPVYINNPDDIFKHLNWDEKKMRDVNLWENYYF